MPRIEILEVVRPPLPADQFWGAHLDEPSVGARREHHALAVAGWVLARDVGAVEVRAVCGHLVVGRWPLDRVRADVTEAFGRPIDARCGFMGVVDALDLPARFEVRVELEHRGQRLVLAVIVGRRAPLIARAGGRLRPLFVTTLGRTGSTMLMHLMGQHARILVQPPFPYEARVTAYWSAIFGELASPGGRLSALVPSGHDRFWWAAADPATLEAYLVPSPVLDLLGGEGLEATAAFARGQVLAFYEAGAAREGKAATGPLWFAEKRLPQGPRLRIDQELFPEARAIYLVRDFRDMTASIMDFNRRRGVPSFGRAAEDDDDAYLAKLAYSVGELMQGLRAAGDSGLLVRYEDAVRDPCATAARVLAFLEVEGSEATVEAMVRAAAESETESRRQHQTVDALASIGRYRRDLHPALIARCDALFADALAACGYAG